MIIFLFSKNYTEKSALYSLLYLIKNISFTTMSSRGPSCGCVPNNNKQELFNAAAAAASSSQSESIVNNDDFFGGNDDDNDQQQNINNKHPSTNLLPIERRFLWWKLFYRRKFLY